MKKYEIKKAFSLLERILLIPCDVVYAEQVLSMMNVYSVKTRKLLGKAKIDQLESNCQEITTTMKDSWISVKTREPSNQQIVMVCTDTGSVGKASFGCYNMKSKIPKWYSLSEEVYGQEITSWQEIFNDK
jgi:hypothetical protein